VPGPARPRLSQACRLGLGQITGNYDRPGPALPKPGLPGPLGTLMVAEKMELRRCQRRKAEGRGRRRSAAEDSTR